MTPEKNNYKMERKISYLIGFFFGGGGGGELPFRFVQAVIERKNVVPSIDKKTTAQPKQKTCYSETLL